ncbi:MAG: methyltransferase type 11 [[Chlorobium] sp. 445]|nr:MAG: methyltransferase type 11 [[Chlorobium] sp. 445]
MVKLLTKMIKTLKEQPLLHDQSLSQTHLLPTQQDLLAAQQDATLERVPVETSEWFALWFNSPIYLKLYEHRNFKEAEKTVETILRYSTIQARCASPKVLDIACGAGRHAVAFAEKGCSVTANDLSPMLLQEARRLAEQHHVKLTFLQKDMREIDFSQDYDLVVQLFTSFGYFEEPDDDKRVLENVYRALKSGGIYVLDFFNATYVRKNYKPLTKRMLDGIYVSEERKIVGDSIKKVITLVENGKLKRFMESVRLYSHTELIEQLSAVGFCIVGILGDYDGALFDPDSSPRVIIFAEKA